MNRTIALLIAAAGIAAAQTGASVPEMAVFDSQLSGLIAKWKVPGASLAIAKDGRLVFAHGYGLANVEAGQPVQPDSLFRIASVSKPFTAVGIMKLVEAGKLDLDARIYPILRDLMPPQGQLADERLRSITVRDLLHHGGGWDDHAWDPIRYLMVPVAAADYFGMPSPPSPRMLIRYVYSNIPLDFAPGTKFAYSNFGYTLLGRVIEEISGLRYEAYIQQEVLAPSGIRRMVMSSDSPEAPMPGEVRYYDYPGAPLAPSIFPEGPRFIPAPYDTDHRMMDAFGGWAASAIDLVRFGEVFAGRRGAALLKPETVQSMIERPAALWPAGSSSWAGLGWMVQPAAGAGVFLWHNGEQQGTRALLVLWPNGISVAVLFNSCPERSDDFLNEVSASLNNAIAGLQRWPAADLFPQYE